MILIHYTNCRFFFSLIICLLVVIAAPDAEKQYTVCQTDECVAIADDLRRSINKSVSPCDDVYAFVCGGWLKDNPVPATETSYGIFTILQNLTDTHLREILEADEEKSDSSEMIYAKRIYGRCMDNEKRNTDGLKALNTFVSNSPEWPILLPASKWDSNVTWQDIQKVYSLYFMGEPFYNIQVMADLKNATIHSIYLMQPSFFLSRTQLTDVSGHTVELEAYTKFIKEVVHAISTVKGYNIDEEVLAKDIIDLIKFETDLANITLTRVQRRSVDTINENMTIEELQAKYDAENCENHTAKINWLGVIRNQFSMTEVNINSTEMITVSGLSYFLKLAHLLERTPPRVIVMYVQWALIRKLIPYTNEEMENIVFAAEQKLLGIREKKERWSSCVQSPNLDNAISYEFIKNYFENGTKEDVLEMLQEIKETIRHEINNTSWMDAETKLAAIDKVNSMLALIGYPNWYSDERMYDYYKDFHMGSTYLETVVNIYVHAENTELQTLREPIDKEKWFLKPTDSNAGYDSSTNSIMMTATILQATVYNKQRPKSMNYGSLNFILGHEISHGYDDVGSKFNKYGKLEQWWTNETLQAYKKEIECFVHQYGNYTVPLWSSSEEALRINGALTLGENIGDSAAVHAVWKTWQTYKKRVGPKEADVRLPGLDEYNDDQLLFISMTRLFCENVRPEFAKMMVEYGAHAPWHIRMVGSLSNLQEYSDTFNCLPKKPMNPPTKCKLWS